FLVELVGDEGIHHRSNIVDLGILTLLQKLSVTVGVFHRDGIAHGECHQSLIKYEQSFATQSLQFPKWDGLCLSPLNHFLDAVRPILRFPAGHKLRSDVRDETMGARVMVTILYMRVQVIINLRHVEGGSLEYVKAALAYELVVLAAHGARELLQC